MTDKEKYLFSHGFRVFYSIDKYNISTVPSAILGLGLESRRIMSVKTGKGGLEMMKAKNDPLVYITKCEESLDVREANPQVNPVLGEYRLSSYIIVVEFEDGENLLKIVPKNPHVKFEL